MNKKNLKDSFCILPFTTVDVRNTEVRGPCCRSKLENNYTGIDEYWESNELESLRSDLLSGIQNPICKVCWKTESDGLKSLRIDSNKRFKREFLTNPKIIELKYNPGRECNLACMMCSEDFSSKFASLWKGEMKPPSSEVPDVDNHKTVSTWIYSNYQQLESLSVNGGEPLYNKKFLNMMDFLIEKNVSKNIVLYISTNATLLPESTIKKLRHFKQVVCIVSIEAVGLPNDYIRWYGNFDKIKKNIEILDKEFDVSVHPTTSALNIIHLPKLEQFCANHGYSMGISTVVEMWSELLPENLPTPLKSLVSDKYQVLVNKSGDPDRLIDFIKKWDQKRNIRIEDYMPEWKGIIDYN